MGRKRRNSNYDVEAPSSESKSFDKWFYSLPTKEQDNLRQSGVLPYSEMSSPQYVFEVQDNNKKWGFYDNELLNTTDEFISADHVRHSLKVFIEALSCSASMEVRKHIELVKWALDLPGKLSSRDLSKMYNMSHISIQKKARELRKQLNVSNHSNNNNE